MSLSQKFPQKPWEGRPPALRIASKLAACRTPEPKETTRRPPNDGEPHSRSPQPQQLSLILARRLLEGESGCGKSSLLASELLPRAREIFTVIECRIENDPLGRLAAALRGERYRRSERETTPKELRVAIAAAGAPPREKGKSQKPVLVSIDQFEELFVTARDEVRLSLMTVLRDAIEAGKIRVLVAIRSDFLDLLLGLCREVDSSGKALDLGSYFPLKAFSGKQARTALGEMLAPLHGGDPLRRQPLEDFSDALVEELLRPPRDRRLSRKDEKTVLPVELQMVGLMLEAVGVEVFSADAFRRRGGKAGLLREYIEDAKVFVWRRTGVSGDQALLILRKLISPARTKWPQTVASISDGLGLRSAEIELVLEAFADRFLVKALPADEAGQTRYELMHEHLVQVLVEAPQPILQKARDAEERLRFWEERAAATFASTEEKGWARRFVQPIPLLEALRLRRFATTRDAQEILRRNLRAFGARLGMVLLPLVVILGGWELWQRSDEYQITRVIEAAASSVDALADREQGEDVLAVAGWAKALFLAGRPAEANSVWKKMKDASARSSSQALAVRDLVRSGRLEEAIFFSTRQLGEKDLVWTGAWEMGLSELMETAARVSRHERVISTVKKIENPENRLKALGIAAEALARAGKVREAAELFGYANRAVPSLSTEQRAQVLVDLATRAHRAQLRAACAQFLRGAVMASRKAKYPAEPLLASAKVFEELGEIDQALSALREGLFRGVVIWRSEWSEEIVQISLSAEKAGRFSDIWSLARSDWSGPNMSLAQEAFHAALICTGHRYKVDAWVSGLDPYSRLRVFNLAVKPLVLAERGREVKELLEGVAGLMPYLSRDQMGFLSRGDNLVEAAVDTGDAALLAKISPLAVGRSFEAPGYSVAHLIGLAKSRSEVALTIAWAFEKKDERLFVVSSVLPVASLNMSSVRLNEHLDRLLSEFRATSGLSDRVLAKLSLALARGGRVKAARDVAAHMKEGRDRALVLIATTFASSGRLDASLAVADDLKGDGILRSETLASIIIESAGRGDDRTLRLLPEVEYPSDISRARSAIAKWQARSGEFSAARAMAETCSPTDKLTAYTDLVMEYALKERKVSSREALSPAATDQVEPLYP